MERMDREMKLVYYTNRNGKEEKITFDECIKYAELYGMKKSKAIRLLHDECIGEIDLGSGGRFWTEEA
jgi:hypothetical protein